MSQFFVDSSGGGGGGSVTLTGDTGTPINGASLTVFANRAANNAGASVQFSNDGGTISTLNVTDSLANTFVGKSAGNTTLTGINNTALGQNSLPLLTSGSYNIAMGRNAGSSYSTGTESSNIVIGYNQTGESGESHVLRIGNDGSGNGEQNQAFIAGILGNTVSNPVSVTIDTVTGQLGQTASAPGGAVATKVTMQVFTSSGTYTPTSGMQYCIVTIVGGGGGGGFANNAPAGSASIGGGAGSGGWVQAVYTSVQIGASQPFVIGAAGAGGTVENQSGVGGGTTTFSSGALLLTATGGGGGAYGSANSSIGSVGAGLGGTSSVGGSISNAVFGEGNPGTNGWCLTVDSGSNFLVRGGGGGNSIIGGAAPETTATSASGGQAGFPATGAGSGGGGGFGIGQNASGGDGFAGEVIVIEFSPGSPITNPTITNISSSDSPYTVLSSDYYISANVTSGTITVLLPDNPSDGSTFIVKDSARLSATNNITVSTVGGVVLIDGSTSYTINVNGVSRSFIWNSFTGAYEVF